MQIEATMTLGKLMARGGLKLMALVSCYFYKSVETSYVLFNFFNFMEVFRAEGRLRFRSWIKAVA